MTRSDPALLDACRQFEAMMLRPLFDSIAASALMPVRPDGDSEAESDASGGGCAAMQGVFGESLALALARAGGIGLAQMLASRLERK
ncbi:MAG: hypothetical protein JO219_00310 [Candidatus Eremiobacteraeota bacterium]|nr:hypothetical protein [Candidatus Eremiobacteraeota bacterium]MBV8366892.1 hypothetical protein [Candidatus Eremiobacteraeota bacterium]